MSTDFEHHKLKTVYVKPKISSQHRHKHKTDKSISERLIVFFGAHLLKHLQKKEKCEMKYIRSSKDQEME